MSDKRWQVAGTGSEIYEDFLVPSVFQPWANILVDAVQPQPSEHVADIACGTGIVARVAAQHVSPGGSITGVDLNPGMIKVARTLDVPGNAKVEWKVGDAGKLPLDDQSCDAVICQLGLQFFPDRLTALKEMRRVAKSGGRAAMLVWRDIRHSPGFQAFAEGLQTHIGPDAAAVMYSPFVFGDDHARIRDLLESAGFSAVKIRSEVRMVRFASVAELVRLYGAGSPLAPHLSGASEVSVESLVSHVTDALDGYGDGEGIAFPIQGHVVTACS